MASSIEVDDFDPKPKARRKMTTISLYVPEELARDLKRVAIKTGFVDGRGDPEVSPMAVQVLEEWVRRKLKQKPQPEDKKQ